MIWEQQLLVITHWLLQYRRLLLEELQLQVEQIQQLLVISQHRVEIVRQRWGGKVLQVMVQRQQLVMNPVRQGLIHHHLVLKFVHHLTVQLLLVNSHGHVLRVHQHLDIRLEHVGIVRLC